jgi:hypothetical protein
MRRVGLVVAVLLSACTPGLSSDEYLSVDEAGLYASVLAHLDAEGHLADGNLVYVVQPDLVEWQVWCDDLEFDDFNEQPDTADACAVAASIEDGAKFEFTRGAAAEVEAALQPATVEFVDSYSDALATDDVPHEYQPVNNDARLIAFSVALESRGSVYLHIDLHGRGVQVEATPNKTGWAIEILGSWMS